MTDKTSSEPIVDGFSDDLQSPQRPEVDEADHGANPKAAKPLSPEEYEKMKQDARERKPADGNPELLREQRKE